VVSEEETPREYLHSSVKVREEGGGRRREEGIRLGVMLLMRRVLLDVLLLPLLLPWL